MSLSWLHLHADHWAVSETNRSEVRRRFVHAAGLTLLEQGLGVLERGIDLDQGVIAKADRGRRTFYNTFDHGHTKSARSNLIHEVMLEVLSSGRSTTTFELADQLTELVAPAAETSQDEFEAAVHRFATDQYIEVLDHDITRLQELLWALGQDDPVVQARFRQMYADWATCVAAGIEAVAHSLDRRLRPPLTPTLVATALTGMIEGLVIRARVDPEAVPRELFGHIVVSLVRGLTEPIGGAAPKAV
jgi:AcrR family transcriptional regulator